MEKPVHPPGFTTAGATKRRAPRFVSVAQLPVNFAKAVLADEADVGAYLETLRKTLIAEIRDGKRILL